MQPVSMGDLLWTLPLFDNVFLSMQGQNIMLVDTYLRDLESSLRDEYLAEERTPVGSAMFVSALSQMWIFASYELLRTWRQSIRDLKHEAAKAGDGAKELGREEEIELADVFWRDYLDKARTDPEFLNALDNANERVDPLFRRIEALRMNLAKHEVKKKPKEKTQRAMAPGYTRIDEGTGSLSWVVDLGNKNVDMVSRRELADDLRAVAIGHLLPEDELVDEEVEIDYPEEPQ